jgi:hypothetical protein
MILIKRSDHQPLSLFRPLVGPVTSIALRLSWACIVGFNCQRCADSPAIGEVEAGGHFPLQPVIKTPHKTIFLLQISFDLIDGILGQVVELVEILCDSISTLFELHKFFLFHMEHSFRNIVILKCQFEFVPGNLMTSRLDSHIISPPSAGRASQLLRRK